MVEDNKWKLRYKVNPAKSISVNWVCSNGIFGTKEASKFPWTYNSQETCYFLEGDVIVTPNGGHPVQMGKGDLVTFPAGMSCTWEIRSDVKKHYCFD